MTWEEGEYPPYSVITGVDFSGQELRDKQFIGMTLVDCTFDGANLSDARFTNATASGCSFRGAKMCETNFTGATLEYADFSRADLFGADLSEVDLTRSSLVGTDLTEACLTAVILGDAHVAQVKGGMVGITGLGFGDVYLIPTPHGWGVTTHEGEWTIYPLDVKTVPPRFDKEDPEQALLSAILSHHANLNRHVIAALAERWL